MINLNNTAGNFIFIFVASAIVFPGLYRPYVLKIKNMNEVKLCLFWGTAIILISSLYVVIAEELQLTELIKVLLFQIEHVDNYYPHKITTSTLCFGYGLILYWLFCLVVVTKNKIQRKCITKSLTRPR